MTHAIEKWSNEFHRAVTEKTYVELEKKECKQVKESKSKQARLSDIFSVAAEQFHEILATTPYLDKKNIIYLKQLVENGNLIYERYELATSGWKRTIMKYLARYTPEFLKKILPSCFSNKMEKAEEETRFAFNRYIQVLNQRILKERIKKEKILGTISKDLHLLNNFQERPLPLATLTKILGKLTQIISELIEQDPTNQEILFELGLSSQMIETFCKSSFSGALVAKNHSQILTELSNTPWLNCFKEALSQKDLVIFNFQKIAGQCIHKFFNKENKRLNEKALNHYRGEIKLTLPNIGSLDEIAEFIRFLKTHPSCHPNSILIDLEEKGTATREFLALLQEIKDYIVKIEVKQLETINFKALAFTSDEEYAFIQNLDFCLFTDLKEIILSDNEKKKWTPFDFTTLLMCCPTLSLLSQCYQQCSNYQDIFIPKKIKEVLELDLRLFPLHQIPHLLSEFSNSTQINLSGLSLSDDQLNDWFQIIDKTKVNCLRLDNCRKLTTDALLTLSQFPNLSTLVLPDLPEGKLPLDLLPAYDNPFKIKLLYTKSRATQSVATSLYTGPHLWSTVFQIPLARQGAEKIFSVDQFVLTPKCVAYWLYDKDYKQLSPQEKIEIIQADFNANIDDHNIIEFMQKFPNAKSLSLYYCPRITDRGIINLLADYPQLTALDLTGCQGVTDALLPALQQLPHLQQLKELIVTATGITSDQARAFRKAGFPLIFEDSKLKITNALLDDNESFAMALNYTDLSKLNYIDLEGCENLTNALLGQLLNYFNAPRFIETSAGLLVDNPQRLNAAVINIKGCFQITEEAFYDEVKSSGITLKDLGNLDRLVIGGTALSRPSSCLKDLYPQINFQEDDHPITIPMNPSLQLEEALNYHQLKSRFDLTPKDRFILKKLGQNYLHNRAIAELFSQDQELLSDLIQYPVDIHSIDFADFTLSFMTSDNSNDITTFEVHRDVLSAKSLAFLNDFRPGGQKNKESGLTCINVNATPRAATAIIDLLYRRLTIGRLDWKTAAEAAELIGPNIFKFHSIYYERLLDCIHNAFDIEFADDFLITAHKLEDQKGRELYETSLVKQLMELGSANEALFTQIVSISRSHPDLATLKMSVEAILLELTQRLVAEDLIVQQLHFN